MDEQILIDFHRKMTDERLNGHDFHESTLLENYRQILSGMVADYSEYRKYVSRFLSSLEFHNTHSVDYSITVFFELYERLISNKTFKPFDLSITTHRVDDDTLEKMKPVFEASLSQNNQQRMSEENFDISNLSGDDRRSMAALIINKIETDSEKLNWSKEMVDNTSILLIFLRQILNALNSAELFYHIIGIFVDRLTSSEYYQAGRDIAEEVILSSYKDGVPELGYLNSFRLYSNSGSVHAALVYANFSLTYILKKALPYSEKYVKEIVWQSLKFFRNVHLYSLAVEIYDGIPTALNHLDYERRSLDHSYFTTLMKMKNPVLPSFLLDYMHKEREAIITGGINEALPWLLTLYNVRRLYSEADFSAAGLGFFLNVFELIVPVDAIKKYKDIIEADSEDLKNYLKESLVKLNETRNEIDFVYDNESAIRISSRLIEYSSRRKDVAAFLLSMILKSDYSILFKEKKAKEFAPLVLPEVDMKALNTLYEDNDGFLKYFPINSNASVSWLASSEGKVYQLQLFGGLFSFNSLHEWSDSVYEELLDNEYFVDLDFNETVIDRGNIRMVSPEEFEEEEIKIAKSLSIAKLQVAERAESVYIIKDMELSKYPHNLFLKQNGDFIAKQMPVTNILSTEWMLQTDKQFSLPKDYRKAVWIPIESGDFTLNYLYNNIEATLHEHSFEVFQQVKLAKPLSSDVNIVCSHGGKNISETQIVFQEQQPTYDLDAIIGKGKILIFFVCYSGSMKTDFFRNNVTSLVKRFIAQGYEAVIAPFWALDVTIPRYWLPEFLISVNAGMSISQAAFNANKKVYERYPTPAAWACLHLYGNPNFKITLV